MTIYDLLAVTAFFEPVVASWSVAKAAHLGIGGYAVALPIGLAVGAGCIWLIYNLTNFAQARSRTYSGRSQGIVAFMMLLGAIIWIGLAGYCGDWIVAASLRFVFRHG